MPDRKAEQVLAALFAAIDAGKPAGVTCVRNEPLEVLPGAAGTMVLFDGEPNEPEVTLSPLTYHYEHDAELEVAVEGNTAADRDAAFDALLRAVGTAIAADRTLGGLCDWVESSAPSAAEIAVEGAAPMKAATVLVTLHYSTADPLA